MAAARWYHHTCGAQNFCQFEFVDEDIHHLGDGEAMPEVVERIVTVVVLNRPLSR